MSSSFAITSATNTVPLDSAGKGVAVFSVYNASGRNLRARARVVANQEEAAGWLELADGAEREFTIASTAQYSVEIAVPSGSPPGPYSFRIDVVAEDNPDEDFNEGPTVTFVVPEPVVEKKKPFPWWIAAASAAVVVVAVVGYLLWPRNAEVPAVAGQTLTQAQATLESAGLTVATGTVGESSDSVPVGQVIRTDPPAGESVGKGSAVTLVLSTGPPQVKVPDVSGQTTAAAATTLEAAGLVVSKTSSQAPSDSLPSGAVVTTSPKAGELVDKGATIELVLSSGPALVVVPKVAGMAAAAATKAIESAGLLVGSQVPIFTGVAGVVVSTTPAAGTKVPPKTKVTLLVGAVIAIPTISLPGF